MASPQRRSVDMSNIAASSETGIRMSREEFRRWLTDRPGSRFERIDGTVVAVAPERPSHADRKAWVWLALRQAAIAKRLPCQVYLEGMTIEIEDSDFGPDAILRYGTPLPGDAVAVPDPLILVEIVSPTTKSDDLTRKLAAYFRVPTVWHHLVVWADQPKVIHHRRRHGGEGIETFNVTSGDIRLDPPGITITFEDVYAG
jgi:Uma2 family endonuclease